MGKPEKKQKINKTALFLIDSRRRQYRTHHSRMAGLQDDEEAGAGARHPRQRRQRRQHTQAFLSAELPKKSRAGGERQRQQQQSPWLKDKGEREVEREKEAQA